MIVYLQDVDVTLYHGDVLDVLRELLDESVDCAATSPPFYGLRDYQTGRWEGGDEGCDHARPSEAAKVESSTLGGRATNQNHDKEPWPNGVCGKCGARRIDQQIGLEATPEEWRDRLVEVFREVRRVLVPTGTLWVECGDSYASHPNGNTKPRNEQGDGAGKFHIGGPAQDVLYGSARTQKFTERLPGLKPKDLIGAPFLLAFGLRDDGWWWRSTNIWMKPNCLPESVTDRPVVQHSYVFQFSKKARYFCDMEAVREPAEWARWGDQTVPKYAGTETATGWMENGKKEDLQARAGAGRSLRSVWTIPTEGYPEAHFATWPTKLAERILLMACPESVCRVCGVARERVVEFERGGPSTVAERAKSGGRDMPHRKSGGLAQSPTGRTGGSDTRGMPSVVSTTLGFTDCNHSDYRPGIVLDPFVGSGTTCHVARKLGRRSVGIDLNAEYLELAAKRLAQQSLLAVEA